MKACISSWGKRVFAVALALVLFAAAAFAGIPGVGEVKKAQAAEGDYGLMDDIQDGVILHCFNWKYSDIEAELANIAAAGFTAVQTSPAQPELTPEGNDAEKDPDIWYWLYQPLGFRVADYDQGDVNYLGDKDDLKSLCEAADEYGVKVIVDVVANHLAGGTLGDEDLVESEDQYGSIVGYSGQIDEKYQDLAYWHTYGTVANWDDRTQVTTGKIGLPDLKSESEEVIADVKAYVEELKEIGVDGIRWDAAKHIALPSEDCNFWAEVTDSGLFNYGEILNNPGAGSYSANAALMAEYTNYMNVTDSDYGNGALSSFQSGVAPSNEGNWINTDGVEGEKLVYWGESHDTYSNTETEHESVSQNLVDRAYAVVASRNGIPALYLSRPDGVNVKDTIKAGTKGTTHFTSPEVAEVNKWHNAMNGYSDTYTVSENCSVITRTKGAVIVAGSGENFEVTVENGGGTAQAGTYTDAITGNTWTVTSETLTGTIGDSGIAVLYKDDFVVGEPIATISKAGGTYTTDTVTFTIGLVNATSGTYSIDGADPVEYTEETEFTFGEGEDYGTSHTIVLTATDGETTSNASYTFTKVEKTRNIAYLCFEDMTVEEITAAGWHSADDESEIGTLYCYAYSSGSNAAWPGLPMSELNEEEKIELGFDTASKVYKYDVTDDLATDYANVMFSSEGAVDPDTGRYPADQEPGLYLTGSMVYYVKMNQWAPLGVEVTPTPSPTPTPEGWTPSPTPTPSPLPTVAPDTAATIYLKNDAGWDACWVYMWKGSSSNASWPGQAMVCIDEEEQLYSFTYDTTKNYSKIIFSQKGTPQTADLELMGDGWTYNNATKEWIEPVGGTPTPTPSPTPTLDPSYTKTIYLKNNAGWSDAYAYMWEYSGDGNHDWPGIQMTLIDAENGIYSYSFDSRVPYTGLIFNDNAGTQTDTIAPNGDDGTYMDGYIYDNATGEWSKYGEEETPTPEPTDTPEPTETPEATETPVPTEEPEATDTPTPTEAPQTATVYLVVTEDGWDAPNAYLWNSFTAKNNGTWPGAAMEVVDAVKGIYSYTYELTNGFDKIIFNNGNGDQTADLDLPGDGWTYYYSTGEWVAPEETPTPTATETPAPTATETAAPTPTNTPTTAPTDTPTAVPTATDTPVPTATDTPVPTATDTPVPTATETPVPAATETAAPTAAAATGTPTPTTAAAATTVTAGATATPTSAAAAVQTGDESNAAVWVFAAAAALLMAGAVSVKRREN